MQEKEIMKKLKKSTLIFLLISLLGCSKDDSSSAERTFADLSGTWEVTSFSYNGTTTENDIETNESSVTSYYAEGWMLDFRVTFQENPNNYSFNGNYNIDYYYTNENGEEYLFYGNLNKNDNGTYVRNSNTNLTFNEGGDYKHVTIHELNDTTLKYSTHETSSETNSDNILISRTRTETYIFERNN